MTDAFVEVDEALARESAAKAWKRAAPFVYGAIAVAILGVGGWEAWRWNRDNQVQAEAKSYAAALDTLEKNDMQGAKKQLEAIAAGKGGFSALANHLLAAVDTQIAGDPKTAEGRLSSASKLSGPMGEVAQLKLAYLKADALSLADLEVQVKPLVDKGGSFGALARELVAAKAFATGDIERARKEYLALSTELDSTPGMQQRVQQAIAVMPPAPAPAQPSPLKPAESTSSTVPAPEAKP